MKADFRNRFLICFVLSVPVIMLTFMVEEGYWIDGKYFFHGSIYITFILSSFIYFYGSLPFIKKSFSEKKKLVVAMTNSLAYFYSCLVLFGAIRSTIVLFWELVIFTDIMLLGYWIWEEVKI